MDLSQEEFKSVQGTPELILHTLEINNRNTTEFNTNPPPTTPICLSDTSSSTSSSTFSSYGVFPHSDSKLDLDEDDLTENIKHLKYKICKLTDKNKELKSTLERTVADYNNLQLENLELLFTKQNKDPMKFFITIGSSISFGLVITCLYKLWN